jgi:hypothetical protein
MFKAGDRVRVKTFEKRPMRWNDGGEMDHLMGEVIEIHDIIQGFYIVKDGSRIWWLTDDDLEPITSKDDSKKSMQQVKKQRTVMPTLDNMIMICDFKVNGAYITKIIYNDPVTVVYWSDGQRTIVKAHNEPFNEEKGLCMTIMKRALGSKFHRFFKELCNGNSD